ncbi:hypothetical protein Pelo_11005 [Pelomyxa schiedti]|nr:hypothetical protein Pelo_11005 [Pelomyxa schiedti]
MTKRREWEFEVLLGALMTIWLSCVLCRGASLCVSPTAVDGGDGSGADWSNPIVGFPMKPARARGNVYLFAAGEYRFKAGIQLDDVENESQFVEFVKATALNHGPDTGWEDSLSDGQVVFLGNSSASGFVFLLRRSFYSFDGVTPFGIKLGFDCSTVHNDEEISDFLMQSFDYSTDFNSVHFRNIEFSMCGPHAYFASEDAVYMYAQQGIHDFVMINCWIHDSPRSALLLLEATDIVIDHLLVERNGGNEESSGLRFGAVSNVSITNSVLQDVQSVNIVFQQSSSDIVVENNLFIKTSEYLPWASVDTTVIGAQDAVDNIEIVGNMFLNVHGLDCGIELSDASDVVVNNNVWAYCVANIINFALPSGTRDYNSFCNNYRDLSPGAQLLDDKSAEGENHGSSCGNNWTKQLFVRYSPGMRFQDSDLHPVEVGDSALWLNTHTKDFFGTPRQNPGPRGAFVMADPCASSEVCGASTPECWMPPVCDSSTGSCISDPIPSADGMLCGDSPSEFTACIEGECQSGVCLGAPSDRYAQFFDCGVVGNGDLCHFECISDGSAGTVECSDSEWLPASISCTSPCEATPSIPHASLRSCSRIREFTTCVYNCDSSSTQLVFKCEDGVWLDETYGATCSEWCCDDNPSFAGYTVTNECSGSAEDDYCTSISCTYSGTITSYPRCLSSGEWSEPSGCLESEPNCGISHCTVCSTSTTCKECDQGWTGSQCTEACTITNCEECSSHWTCSECSYGTLPNSESTVCASSCNTIDHCLVCNDGACAQCEDGYTPPDCTVPSCSIVGCERCSQSGLCVLCSDPSHNPSDGGTVCTTASGSTPGSGSTSDAPPLSSHYILLTAILLLLVVPTNNLVIMS